MAERTSGRAGEFEEHDERWRESEQTKEVLIVPEKWARAGMF